MRTTGRPWWPVALAVSAGIAVAAAGALYWSGLFLPREGPLAWRSPIPAGATGLVHVGRAFSYGLLTDVENHGANSAQLIDIHLESASVGLSLIHAQVTMAASGPTVGLLDKYPPPENYVPGSALRPLSAARINPGDGVDVLLALQVDHAGVFEFRGLVLTYRVGLVRYRAEYPLVMSVCAPPSKYPNVGACPRPGDND